jgi:hypothetical protein
MNSCKVIEKIKSAFEKQNNRQISMALFKVRTTIFFRRTASEKELKLSWTKIHYTIHLINKILLESLTLYSGCVDIPAHESSRHTDFFITYQ